VTTTRTRQAAARAATLVASRTKVLGAWTSAFAASLLVVTSALVAHVARSAPAAHPRIWRLFDGRVTPEDGADEPRGVGSLQKAWLVAAWSEAHPDAPLPRLVCTRESRCWLAKGHGAVDLRSATARSCNAYFRALAKETPAWRVAEAFRRAGFVFAGTPTPDAAIGLEPALVLIAPRALLAAYIELVKTPWVVRDDARREWLLGMRDAATDGTAARFPLRGLLAKTGTVPSSEPLGTSGWALALDPSGASGALAYLPRGTGADAAAALGAALLEERPWAPARTEDETPRPRRAPSGSPSHARARAFPDSHDSRALPARDEGVDRDVRVRLFTALEGFPVHARNAGTAPAERDGPRASWISPGSELTLEAGDRLSRSAWELTIPTTGLVRVVAGEIEARAAPAQGRGALRVVLATSTRAYAEGVVRGELGAAEPARAEELAAAVVRFLARGARHGTEDVCDLSHCARFVGLGPELAWKSATHARVVPTSSPRFATPLDDAAWARARDAATRPGPASWTADCGGEPLSERAVWGAGGDDAPSCPRHAARPTPWTREVAGADVAAALGDVVSISAETRDGTRVTRVATTTGERALLYDEMHRLLAARAGWDALPSPPDSWERTPRGWRVTGRGSGHRVGVCLGGTS
jgi:stage II sporulation protein D